MAFDWCDEEGAKKLAQRIREYWERRGHTVDVRLQEEAFNMRMRSASWNVRSDMVNGKPRPKKTILEKLQHEPKENPNNINAIRNRKDES